MLAAVLLFAISFAHAQDSQPFTLKTHTEEVHLSFRAEDARGTSIDDLQQSDLKLLDNGHPPDRITHFEHRTDLPLRIGLLLDTSPSMGVGPTALRIATQFEEMALRSTADRTMMMAFDFEAKVIQDWTADPAQVAKANADVLNASRGRLGGTALYDSVYIACRDHFTAELPGAGPAGNAIILFTDGEDNRSHALLSDVIEECQEKDTAVYAVVYWNEKSKSDAGQKQLRTLAGMTGGRVFYQEKGAFDAMMAAQRLSQDLRNRYLLTYRPPKAKQDGSFHKIQLTTPSRQVTFNVRTGYFAVP